MQAPPVLFRPALERRRDTELAPMRIFRQQAIEPNRLSEVTRLYINVDNDDVMDSLQPFVELLPNNATIRNHERYSNTAEKPRTNVTCMCDSIKKRNQCTT